MTPLRARSFQSCADALDRAAVPFAVMRGWQDWPSVTGDVDLLVRSSDLTRAVERTRSALQEQGWEVIVTCEHVDIPVVWAANGLAASPDLIEVDLAPMVTWAGGSFLDVERAVLERRLEGPVPRLRPGDESVVLGLPALLGSDAVRRTKGAARLRQVAALVAEDPQGARTAWREAIGFATDAVLEAVSAEDMAAFDAMAVKVRAVGIIRSFTKNPVGCTRRVAFVSWQRRRTSCCLWRSGHRSLDPLRCVDADLREWQNRMAQIASEHTRC